MLLCIKYIYFPSTGYSEFEMVYLNKPADLNHIEYSPLQHLTRSLDVYTKIMKKRFNVMRKIVLDKISHDQSVQQIRQIRPIHKNQTLAVGTWVYLFAPSAASLQTISRKLKEEGIGLSTV